MTNFELQQRIRIEKQIYRQVIKDALAAGYYLNVNNGGEDNELAMPTNQPKVIYKHMNLSDEDFLLVYIPKADGTFSSLGWVRFVYGNDGWDVVCDYTVNLEPIMQNADKLSEKYQ